MGGSGDIQEINRKHEREKAIQEIVYLWARPEEGVHGAVLNAYWMNMTRCGKRLIYKEVELL